MMKYQDIAHPEDRKALQVLQKVPLLDEGCRNIMEYGYERIFRGENLATMVKANAGSMPVVYQLMEATAQKVGVPTPEVYVYNDPVMNAFTYGETNTFICISRDCRDKRMGRAHRGDTLVFVKPFDAGSAILVSS